MPIASKAGPSEDYIGSGNFNRGVGINLRGLGVEATLVFDQRSTAAVVGRAR